MKKKLSQYPLTRIIMILCLVPAVFSCGHIEPQKNTYYWWTGYTQLRDFDSDGTVDSRIYKREYDSRGRVTKISDNYSNSSSFSHYEILEYSDNGSTTVLTNNRYRASDDSQYARYIATMENGRKIETYDIDSDKDGDGIFGLDDTDYYCQFTYDSQGRPLAQYEFHTQRVQDTNSPDFNKVTGYSYWYDVFEYSDSINKITGVKKYFRTISLASNSTFLESQPSSGTAPEMTAGDLNTTYSYEYDSQGRVISADFLSKYLYFYDTAGRISEERRVKDINGDDTIEDTETYFYSIYTYNGTERTKKSYGDLNGTVIATADDEYETEVTVFRDESDLLKFYKSDRTLSSKTYKDMNSDGSITMSDADLLTDYSYTYDTSFLSGEDLINIQYEEYSQYDNYWRDANIWYWR